MAVKESSAQAEQIATLMRTVEELKRQTGFVDHPAEQAAEHKRLCAQAEREEAAAIAAVSQYDTVFAQWRARGEAAIAKLPNPNNDLNARAFPQLMQGAQDTCQRMRGVWKAIQTALAAPEAVTRLAGIAAEIHTAQVDLATLSRTRDGIRRLVAEMEYDITMHED